MKISATFRLERDLKVRASLIAKREGRTLTNVVEASLTEYCSSRSTPNGTLTGEPSLALALQPGVTLTVADGADLLSLGHGAVAFDMKRQECRFPWSGPGAGTVASALGQYERLDDGIRVDSLLVRSSSGVGPHEAASWNAFAARVGADAVAHTPDASWTVVARPTKGQPFTIEEREEGDRLFRRRFSLDVTVAATQPLLNRQRLLNCHCDWMLTTNISAIGREPFDASTRVSVVQTIVFYCDSPEAMVDVQDRCADFAGKQRTWLGRQGRNVRTTTLAEALQELAVHGPMVGDHETGSRPTLTLPLREGGSYLFSATSPRGRRHSHGAIVGPDCVARRDLCKALAAGVARSNEADLFVVDPHNNSAWVRGLGGITLHASPRLDQTQLTLNPMRLFSRLSEPVAGAEWLRRCIDLWLPVVFRQPVARAVRDSVVGDLIVDPDAERFGVFVDRTSQGDLSFNARYEVAQGASALEQHPVFSSAAQLPINLPPVVGVDLGPWNGGCRRQWGAVLAALLLSITARSVETSRRAIVVLDGLPDWRFDDQLGHFLMDYL